MILLRAIKRLGSDQDLEQYPFSIPALKTLDSLPLTSPVTFFAGENGSGKSTLLEAIAAGAGLQTLGGIDVAVDPTLEHARRLADQLRFTWNRRAHRGFFLRAEDFFNFALRTSSLEAEMVRLAAEHEVGSQAYAALRGQAAAVRGNYGDLQARSHGERFFDVFRLRFVPGGLYLLDEPDTAFSAQRQLAMLSLLIELVNDGAQFLIATHSPILLALPGATILSFDGGSIGEIAYEDVPNVRLTREFLGAPEMYLRHL